MGLGDDIDRPSRSRNEKGTTMRVQMHEWVKELVEDAYRIFGPGAACGICGLSDDDTLCSIVDYAWALRAIGRKEMPICGGCAHDVANLYTYKHGGRAEFDFEGEWPAPAPSSKTKQRKISHKKVMRIFERDGYRCKSCGSQSSLVPDHVLPISKGGGDEDENLQTLCAPCNSSKGASITWRGRQGIIS